MKNNTSLNTKNNTVLVEKINNTLRFSRFIPLNNYYIVFNYTLENPKFKSDKLSARNTTLTVCITSTQVLPSKLPKQYLCNSNETLYNTLKTLSKQLDINVFNF